MNPKIIKFIYKNWRNEIGERIVLPINIWFGKTEFYKDEQWLLKAKDIKKDQERDFALKNIIEWK